MSTIVDINDYPHRDRMCADVRLARNLCKQRGEEYSAEIIVLPTVRIEKYYDYPGDCGDKC